jgi:aspartate dehydrogenase
MEQSGKPPLRLGLIGLGAIGGAVAEIASRHAAAVQIVGALVADSQRARPPLAPPVLSRLEQLLEARPEVVIECAGQPALREFGPALLRAGVDLVPSSVGLFADDAALALFRDARRAGNARIRLCNGAVAGLDGLLAARTLGLESVRYRFVMSPAAWGHARAGDGLAGGTAAETVMFRGTARQAALEYPKHANVTATLSLAGIGLDRTQVELVVDESATHNRHEIHASGFFGTLAVVVKGKRISERSPSSRLVAGSLFATALASHGPLIE